MKVLHVGIFNDHCLGGDIIFSQGFRANGIDCRQFDYRTIAARVGIGGMNRELKNQVKGCDLVFIGKGELVSPDTLKCIGKNGAAVSIWYGDIRPEPEDWLVENMKHCDVFFMSSAGQTLQHYFQKGHPGKAAFYLNPCNPEILDDYSYLQPATEPPIFTGTAHDVAQVERRKVYEYICRRKDVQIFGSPAKVFKNRFAQRLYTLVCPTRYIRGDQYIEHIIRSKMGIGVSAVQNVKYYSSDRLSHYLALGTFYLCYRFPGCEDLFEDERHLVYFDDVDDLHHKIEHYLRNPERANSIGVEGQNKMVKDYNAKRMIKMMLEVIEHGTSEIFPWVEVHS